MFNSYAKLPEGNNHNSHQWDDNILQLLQIRKHISRNLARLQLFRAITYIIYHAPGL